MCWWGSGLRSGQVNLRSKFFAFLFVTSFFLIAYLAFALPAIFFEPPTLNDSSTTGANWVFVNISSSEPLNQSLLEWGNSSGYFNFSMLNFSQTNWYLNVSNLSDGAYNYTLWAQNLTGDWNRTTRRYLAIDTIAPNITVWSTNGTNASNPQDVMFLVGVGESVLFNVTVVDTTNVTYQWLLNKIDQYQNSNNFTFNIPSCDHANDPSSCIWEIHMAVNDSTGLEAHKEWVVSNLSISEAPDFFDYFTDEKISNRTQLDPWGRAVQNWTELSGSYTGLSASTGYAHSSRDKETNGSETTSYYAPSASVYGTFIMKFRWNHPFWSDGVVSDIAWYFAGKPKASGNAVGHYLTVADDDHNWLASDFRYDSADPPYPNESNMHWLHKNMGLRGVADFRNYTQWATVKIIHTPDGHLRVWKGDDFLYNSYVDITDANGIEGIASNANYTYLSMRRFQRNATGYTDMMQIYNGSYFFPKKSISYKAYPMNYTIYSGMTNGFANGIVIDGRDVGVGDINSSISNATLFEHPANNTAYLHTNLVVEGGALLNLSNQKITMDDGLELKLKNGAELFVSNSTLTSNGTFYWTVPSEYFLNGERGAYDHIDFKGVLKIYDSVVENSSFLYLVGAETVELVNVKFNNLQDAPRQIPYSDNPVLAHRQHSGSNHSMSFKNRQPMKSFKLFNISFTGPPNTFKVLGTDSIAQMVVYDSNLPNTTFVLKEGPVNSQMDTINASMASTVYLVNTVFADAVLATNKTALYSRQYLDAYVVDGLLSPVRNALVVVSNEVDPTESASNIHEQYAWTHSFSEGWYNHNMPYKRLLAFDAISSTITGQDGHTPSPSNKTNTLIISDYKLSNDSLAFLRTNYTYAVFAYDPSSIWTNVTHTIYPNGTIQQLQPLANVSGINPDSSWYRSNPNTYQNTTVLQINYSRTNITVNTGLNATNITVTKWNTYLPQGQILVNFTAESVDGNNVNFTLCSLTVAKTYAIRKDGSSFASKVADSQGCVLFNNSAWTSHTFTVEEQSQGPSGCSAINAAFYNTSSNTIVLNNQTSTLCTIYYDVNNSGALSYGSSTSTYLLYANISLATGTALVINNTNLVFNGTGRIQIYTSGCCERTLVVYNSSITSTEGYGRFSVRGSINITNSVLSNLGRSDDYSGYGSVVYGQAFDSSSYYIVENNTIRDSYHNFNSVGYENAGNVLRFTNNNVSNMQRNVLSFYNQNANGLIANNTFTNSTRTGAMAETNAVIIPCFNCTTEYNLFDGFGDGVTTSAITAKEKEVVTHRYNTIKNGAAGSTGIMMYFSWPYTPGNRGYAYNNTIINVETGITTNGDSIPGEGGQWVIYNNTILDSAQIGLSIAPGNAAYNSMFYGNFINNSGFYNIYVGSGDMQNISVFSNTLGVSGSYSVYLYGASSLTYYDNFQQATGSNRFAFRSLGPTTRIVNPNDISVLGYYPDGVFNLYYYLDVNLTDKGGNAVPNAEVRVTNEANSSYPAIAISTPPQERSVFHTASNGHTSTPSENASNAVVVMDYWETASGRQNMTYAVSAYDPAHIWTNVTHTIYPNGTIQQLQPLAQVTGANPDASWYRPNPNAYQNTTTLQINYTKTNITVNANQNATNITVSKWNTSLSQGQILVNFTAESVSGNNVNFTVCSLTATKTYAIKNDGSAFTTKTADSLGCIWFNNSVWTSHEFTLEEQSSGTPVTACGDLNVSGSYYTLTQNVNSSGTCFNILADNITLDGQGFTVDYSQSVTGYGVNISNRNNVTVKNLNVVQGNSSVPFAYAIYGSGMVDGAILNAAIQTSGSVSHGVYLTSSSSSNSLLNNNITVSGSYGVFLESYSNANALSNNTITANSRGIYLYQSSTNILSDNAVSGSSDYGIILFSGSNSNTLLNNNISTSHPAGIGLFVASSSSNNATGGSITSKLDKDYVLSVAGANNNFKNTNFTASRRIGFDDNSSWFNYNNETNGNIWLKTRVSAASTLIRTISAWSQLQVKWNDTNSTAGITAGYNLTGLLPNSQYRIYATSSGVRTNPYNLTTDADGVLNFTLALGGNTEVNVWALRPPAYSLNSTSSTGAGASIVHSLYWASEEGLAGYVFSFDNCTGTFVNDTWVPMAGLGNWSAVTKTANLTVGCTVKWKVYANDTSNRWNESQSYSYVTTNNAPYYSNVNLSTDVAGQPAEFSAYWQDDAGLAGFIFSTNNSGVWQNESWQPFSGIANWSRFTKTLNSTRGMSVGYRFYANDTSNKWNDTGVLSFNTVLCHPLGAAVYNSTTGVITLYNQTSTVCTIYLDVNNESILSYNDATMTYMLNAKINSSSTAAASLNISDTTLLMNNTADDEYYIRVGWDLTISNATIKSNNGKKFYFVSPTKAGAGYTVQIRGSLIDGGWIRIAPPDMVSYPGEPVRVTNTTIRNLNMTGSVIGYPGYDQNEAGALGIRKTAGHGMYLDGITIENVTGGDSGNASNGAMYSAPIYFESDAENATIKNVVIRKTSHPSRSVIFWKGGMWKLTLTNITIDDVTTGNGNAIGNKEGLVGVNRSHRYTDLTILNYTGKGVSTYQNMFEGNNVSGIEIENLVLDASLVSADPDSYFFYHDYAEIVNVWVFNAALKNAEKGFYARNNNYYFTNALVQNVLITLYANIDNGNIYWYELLDVLVKDSNGVAVSNATLIITPNATAPASNVVTKWFYNQTSIVTGLDGHTPLPDNENGAVAILRERVYTGGSKSSYSYNVSVFDPSGIWTNVTHTIYPNGTIQQLQPLAQVTGANPDESWYRSNPNTYQNTTVLQINYTRTNITVNANQNATNITVSKWNTSLSQGQILVNFTAESVSGNNVNFTVCNLTAAKTYAVKNDGSTFTIKTADSQGCIWFNNSVWASHVFTVEEQSQGPSGCSAINAAFYNASSNLIVLNNQTSTLCTLFYDVNNPAVLSYDTSTNTYSLSADINNVSGQFAATAHLKLDDAKLILNTSGGQRSIKTWADIYIENMTIEASDPTSLWLIWSFARFTQYTVGINDSVISGGRILVQPNGYQTPRSPVSIRNNRFHGTVLSEDYMLDFGNDGAINGYWYNNTFIGVQLTAGQYNGILKFNSGYSGALVDRLYVYNSSVNSYGAVYSFGSSEGSVPMTISNFEIKNIAGGDGLSGKEHQFLRYVNGIISNVSNYGILYYRSSGYGETPVWVANVTIDKASYGISNNGCSDYTTADIFDVRISNITNAVFRASGPSIFYVTNYLARNYGTLSATLCGSGEVRTYFMADALVKDSGGNPVDNATVAITSGYDTIPRSVSRNFANTIPYSLQPLDNTYTRSNGHTPLPNEDANNTIVLLYQRKINNTPILSNYSYNFSVFDPSSIWTNVTHTIYPNGTIQQLQPLAQATGVNSDASWYRSNPNTYQNTTVLQINYIKTSLTIAVTNVTNLTVSEYSSFRINFTATNSTASQKMNITVSNGTFPVLNGYPYVLKKDGLLQSTQIASVDKVVFANIDVGSEYLIEVFTNLAVSLNSPPDNLLTNNPTLAFNCSAFSNNSLVNIALYGNFSGVFVQDGSVNASGHVNSTVFVRVLPDGYYLWNCLAYDAIGAVFALDNYTFTVDTVAPGSIMNLVNRSQSTDWLFWDWSNPASDFGHVEVFLNGVWVENTSSNFYNATGLNASTWYLLSVRAVDSAGNVNWTWVNVSARTLDDTAPPVITILLPANATYNYNQSLPLVFSVSEPASWCGYSLDGASNVTLPFCLNSTLNVSSGGSHSLRVYAKDSAGNLNFSVVYFSVDVLPPVISNVSSGSVTSGEAVILWDTDELGDSTVFYGVGVGLGSNKTNANLTSTHSLFLDGLYSSTKYYYNVSSCDVVGNCNVSIQYSFSTSAASNTPPGSSPSGGSQPTLSSTGTKSVILNTPTVRVAVALKSELSNPSLVVSIPSSVPAPPPSGLVYKYLNFTKAGFNNSDVESAEIEFKVNKSWLYTNSVEFVYLSKHSNGWAKLKTELVNSTGTQNTYRAQPSALSYFAIVGERSVALPEASALVKETAVSFALNQTTPAPVFVTQSDIDRVRESLNSVVPRTRRANETLAQARLRLLDAQSAFDGGKQELARMLIDSARELAGQAADMRAVSVAGEKSSVFTILLVLTALLLCTYAYYSRPPRGP